MAHVAVVQMRGRVGKSARLQRAEEVVEVRQS